MKILALGIAIFGMSSIGHAQSGIFYSCNANTLDIPSLAVCPNPTSLRPPSGDTALDRAITICDSHRSHSIVTTEPETLLWRDGYENCSIITDAWNRTSAAAIQRAKQAADDADKAFVNDYSRRLETRPK